MSEEPKIVEMEHPTEVTPVSKKHKLSESLEDKTPNKSPGKKGRRSRSEVVVVPTSERRRKGRPPTLVRFNKVDTSPEPSTSSEKTSFAPSTSKISARKSTDDVNILH